MTTKTETPLTIARLEDLTTEWYQLTGLSWLELQRHLNRTHGLCVQVLRINGLYAITCLNEQVDSVRSLMAELYGIDDTGKPFAYDTEPLPAL